MTGPSRLLSTAAVLSEFSNEHHVRTALSVIIRDGLADTESHTPMKSLRASVGSGGNSADGATLVHSGDGKKPGVQLSTQSVTAVARIDADEMDVRLVCT